ncbi:unnamed protein product [Anisakis simplex]|uniref:Fatty-acid and retinol-binding protein 1 n=1 Tax=Anisakis simplex TaxID=6269 RepID=A0A0M3K1I6_ANISI|nr:unnamed protein product [Anisakis simplex]
MLRAAVILSLCFVYSLAYTIPASMSAIPEEFKEFIPEKVREFYKQLTPEDKEALREVVAGHADYANVDDALNALKEKNEKLYQKALEVFEKMRELRPAAGEKPNLEQVKTAVREVVDKYKALPEPAKQDLKTHFPTVTRLIQTYYVLTFASKVRDQMACNRFLMPFDPRQHWVVGPNVLSSDEKFRKLAKGFLNKQP